MIQMKSMIGNMQVKYQQHSSSQQLAISGLKNDITSLWRKLDLANSKLSVFKTLDAAVTSSVIRRHLHATDDQTNGEDGFKKRPSIKDTQDTALAVQVDVPPRQLVPDPQQAPVWAQPPAVAMPPRELVYSTEARITAEGNSNKDIFISLVLQDLYRRRLLKVPVCMNIDPPRYDYKYC